MSANVRFGSLADICNAEAMSALPLIATVKADIALQDACSSHIDQIQKKNRKIAVATNAWRWPLSGLASPKVLEACRG